MSSKRRFSLFRARRDDEEDANQAANDAYNKMFEDQQGFDFNLSAGAAAQVDAGSRAYLAKLGEKPKAQPKTQPKTQPKAEEAPKIKQSVPKIGALGAFAALGGGLIGSMVTSPTVAKKEEEEEEEDVMKPDPTSTEVEVEAQTGDRYDLYKSDAVSSTMMRKYATGNGCCDDSHSAQLYPHAHHVMPRIRHRSKKISFSSDGNSSGGEEYRRRKAKKTKRPHQPLPTIRDERRLVAEVEAATTTADDDSEREGSRRKKISTVTFSDNELVRERTISGSSFRSESESEDDNRSKGDAKKKKSSGGSKKVMFSVGHPSDRDSDTATVRAEGDKDRHSRHKNKSRLDQELKIRRRVGSQVHMDDYQDFATEDEDFEHWTQMEMASHRMEKSHSRHKISRVASSGVLKVKRKKRGSKEDGLTDDENKYMEKLYGPVKTYDHSPHAIFVELDQLDLATSEWVEEARWVKYEESKEAGSERWGRPHLSSLSFHSLINLRIYIERGIIMLDLEAKDFTNVSFKVTEEFCSLGLLREEHKSDLLRILLLKHRFVDAASSTKFKKMSGIKKSMSKASIGSLLHSDDTAGSKMSKAQTMVGLNQKLSGQSNGAKDDHTIVELGTVHSDSELDGIAANQSFATLYNLGQQRTSGGIIHRLKEGTEGTVVLVGKWPGLVTPLCGFIRLAEGIHMPNLMEVNIPVRFMFIFLVPPFVTSVDPYEVGRSLSTLMANPSFHMACYKIEDRRELLSALNDFLDESVVLPPGDWDSKNLISLSEIRNLRDVKKARKDAEEQKKKGQDEETKDSKGSKKGDDEEDDEGYNPMQLAYFRNTKFPSPWGGVIGDIKYRFPFYLSDFIDGLNGQALAASIFIYFAALSGAIAFGGLTGSKSEGLIGIPETIITSAVAGSIFALLAGQPMIITGVTGPILLYDESLYSISKSVEVEFLPFRVWVGVWVVIIALLVSCFQGSVLVRLFTKFTKDIFASLVALLFIFEALRKLSVIFSQHPLRNAEFYCNGTHKSFLMEYLVERNDTTGLNDPYFDTGNGTVSDVDEDKVQPNTSLLSLILMFGTFFISYFLRIFRNGKYLSRTIRRALGDFGVPIGIIIMVAIDYFAGDTYTEKLDVPDGLQVTSPHLRGWLINPFGMSSSIPSWLPFMAALPAFLLYMVLFIETEICELLMMEKSSRKGGGLHWDILLLCLINSVCAIFGGPWICAATVRACAHVSALTVWSTTHAPGEAPKIIEVKDQRLSALVVSILLGLSVLLSSALKQVPFAVLFGVFLYMGVSSIGGIQFFDRLTLFVVPVKYHPGVSYVRRVKTLKMHLYTFIQACGLAVLWAVKSSPAALAFPFFVAGMIPLRFSLKFLFTERELEELDGKAAGQIVNDGDADFYEEGIGG